MRSVRRESLIASTTARRSPDTSVMSLASIATSVPVPIARPRSACASAGASLTPSPTIATSRRRAANGRRRRLVLGQNVADHLLDARLGGGRPRRLLVVPREQDRRQAQLAQLGDRLPRGRLDAVGEDEQARNGSVAAGDDQCAALPRRRARPVAAARARALGRRAGTAGRRGPSALDDRFDAEAAAILNRSTAGRVPASERAKAAIARAIGCSLASSTEPASRSSSARSAPSATATSTQLHPALGHRAGLVEHDRVDRAASARAPRGPLIRMPSCAPRPVPTMSAVGVASPSAQGHAMISTATAAVNAAAASAPASEPAGERRERDARSRRARRPPRPGRRDAAPAPCPPAPARRAARSARAPCRRRPASPRRRGGRTC